MTLVVALKANNAIILAADSRGTIGDPRGLTAINDTMIKIYPLGRWGVAFAGASEMGATLLDELNKEDDLECLAIDELVANVARKSVDLFSHWFREIPPQQRPAVLMTLAGYRTSSAGVSEPMLYILNSQANFAPQLFGQTSLSGVPQYAVYLVHRYYDPSISVEKAKALAEYLIRETASQDPKVGGPIRMAEITPIEGYRELAPDTIKGIHEANEELNERLRRFFLSELEGGIHGAN